MPTYALTKPLKIAAAFLSLAGLIGAMIGGAWGAAVASGRAQAERDILRQRVDQLERRFDFEFGPPQRKP
jgi:hypothetical protein